MSLSRPRPVTTAPRLAGLGLLALALLLLPLLAAVLTLGPGGLPHEAQASAAPAQDLSQAALNGIDRWLSGGLCVVLAELGDADAPAAPCGAALAPAPGPVAPVAPVAPGLLERRL